MAIIKINKADELAKAKRDNPGETIVLERKDGSKTMWRDGGKPVSLPKPPKPRYTKRSGNGG